MRSPGAAVRVWAIPALLALSTAAGLLAGLLGDGPWDAAGWCALGLPLAVALGCLWRGRYGDTAPIPSRTRAGRL